ncbi:putative ribokinase-like [Apostichopus japonicus]|uniref:Ribokinase n=1 Tax=Stichopus japonicus TaxID=307972 RepID=A0A2G8L1Y5_STIJA|nr:putative ribokinase-like [Apostichopus japonicus]
MQFDVLIVGSCCIDFIRKCTVIQSYDIFFYMILYSSREYINLWLWMQRLITQHSCYVPQFPKPGETIHGHKFVTSFGGKGANQSVMAARLGAKVSMVAKVGDDTFGKDTVENFTTNSVNTGQNSFVSVKGSNDLLTPGDVEKAFSQVKSAKVVVSEMEIRGETTLRALQLAKESGSLTVLNPSPAITNLDSEFYKVTDIMCINQLETELLTGLPVNDVDEAKKAALVLLERGCQKVIITLGKDGAVLVTTETKTPEHIPVDPVTPVDTTGAGDSFIGALAFYLAHLPSLPMNEIVRRSGRIAAVSVLSSGTQLSYPWKRDLPTELFV